MNITKLICLGVVLIALVNCATPGGEGGISKQHGGAALGAITGALVGSKFGKGNGNFLATGLGAILGGVAGSTLGKQLDDG